MIVVSISGKRRGGKDTLADLLIRDLDGIIELRKESLASPLKDYVASAYSLSRESLDDSRKDLPLETYPAKVNDNFSRKIYKHMWRELKTLDGEPLGLLGAKLNSEGYLFQGSKQLYHTPRTILILEGGLKRAIDPNFWVNKLIWSNREDSVEGIIIPDLRFKNEAVRLKEVYGEKLYLIRVERDLTGNSQDPTECDLDEYTGFDDKVYNNGTLKELEEIAFQINKDILQLC